MEERRIRGDVRNEEGASNAVSMSRLRMKRRIRGGAAVSIGSKNRAEPNARAGCEVGEMVIRWERFLPRRCLRVLLVEFDDSTRHIVAALLRKCSYQVAAVADGLKAWEFLKEKHYNFDLVLTEVAMPSFSGIDLLSKIMSNDIYKHIPVIMMSSHDSIGIVFKCMLKGAADFLVKPVRKNELRNLWQHVWRKYRSSSCGNGSTNENPYQARYEAMSDNNADSNHASANAGNKSRTRNSSERGSDSQSSCSKPKAENEIEQEIEEPAHIQNRILSRENESKLQKYDNDVAQVATTPSMQEDEQVKDKRMGLEIKVTLSIQAAASTEKSQDENSFNGVIPYREENQGSVRPEEDSKISDDPFNQSVPNEPSRPVIDFIGTIPTGQCSYTVLGDNVRQDVLSEATKFLSEKESASNIGSSPLWELSLKRPQINNLDGQVFQERHVLRQSDASAFSLYGSRRSLSFPKTGTSSASLCVRTKECSGNCHPPAGCQGTPAGKTISFPVREGNEVGGESLMHVHCQPSSGTDKEDADPLVSSHLKENPCVGHCSTEERLLSHPQLGVFPLPIPVSSMPFQSLCAGYGSMLQPIFYPDPSLPVHGSAAMQKAKQGLPYDQSAHSGNHLTNNIQYIDCHHCDQNHVSNQSKQGMTNHWVEMERADSRAVFQVAEEADQSACCSRSIHNGSGSNGNNEDASAAANAGAALESGNEDGFQSCNGKGSDHHRARREAALIKFRLKRKDRCFEKKVRYHSRKKLAEQRPRLKGQFVRQTFDSATTATETDD